MLSSIFIYLRFPIQVSDCLKSLYAHIHICALAPVWFFFNSHKSIVKVRKLGNLDRHPLIFLAVTTVSH
nr:MAG TPA: hypothetical protein [Caudoviricetes sp.]